MEANGRVCEQFGEREMGKQGVQKITAMEGENV